jgi:hypothetical protein
MNTPETNTNSTLISISVSGLGVISYKYLLDNPSGDWDSQTEIPYTVPITAEGLLEDLIALKLGDKMLLVTGNCLMKLPILVGLSI